ncbi:MAG: glycosyltransferase [Candidatus Acidiferrales bacterium]
MRILKVTQSYSPFLDKGGPTVKVRSLARGLAARGHKVTVLTADLGLGPETARQLGAVRYEGGWTAEEDGVEVIYLRVLGRYRALTWNPGALRWCRKNIGSYDVAHIYGMYDWLGPVAAHVCHGRGVPYIVEPMGMFRPIVRNVPLKWMYRWLIGDRILRHAKFIVATAERERHELESGGIAPSQIVVRRNGIDAPLLLPAAGAFRKQWNIAPDAKLVLFLGRIVKKKSPDLALEAFADWRNQAGDNRAGVLVIAGPHEEDHYRRTLESHAARLGLRNAVIFPGALHGDAKWAAYRDADLFVLPSQNENFGNTAGEAVACDTPVLVTDRCGIAPLVQDRAGSVVPFDRVAFAKAFAQLLDDDQLRNRLRAGCAEVARELTWDAPLDEMERVYSSAVAGTRPA